MYTVCIPLYVPTFDEFNLYSMTNNDLPNNSNDSTLLINHSLPS